MTKVSGSLSHVGGGRIQVGEGIQCWVVGGAVIGGAAFVVMGGWWWDNRLLETSDG